jgi:hypothetical protein
MLVIRSTKVGFGDVRLSWSTIAALSDPDCEPDPPVSVAQVARAVREMPTPARTKANSAGRFRWQRTRPPRLNPFFRPSTPRRSLRVAEQLMSMIADK